MKLGTGGREEWSWVQADSGNLAGCGHKLEWVVADRGINLRRGKHWVQADVDADNEVGDSHTLGKVLGKDIPREWGSVQTHTANGAGYKQSW